MKVKLILALALLATIAFSSAEKVQPDATTNVETERVSKDEPQKDTQSAANKAEDIIVDEKADAQPSSSAPSSKLQRREDFVKDVHKRGIYYSGGLGYGGAHAAHAVHATSWPKSYDAHYGYSLNLPGATSFSNVAAHSHAHSHAHASPFYAHAPAFAHSPAFAHAPTYAAHGHAHAPTFVKYPSASGYHLKHFAAGASAIPLASYGGSSIGLGHSVVGLGAVAAATPAYSTPAVATLPHAHVSSFAHAVGTAAPAVASAAPVSPFVLRPGGAVVSSYNVNYPRFQHKPVYAVPQPVQPVAHVHPVQPVQPVQPVAAVAPVQPVHTVVQVQHATHPLASVQPSHHFPHYFQTTFVQPQRIPVAVPAAPVHPVSAIPVSPSFPVAPSFATQPTFPAIPTFPTAPAVPTIPAIPTIPAVPAIPTTPAVPTTPTVSVPTRPQQTPAFVSIPVQPEAQFPPLGPIPGSQRPQGGSAEAAPQIPNLQPVPGSQPQPELPAVQGGEEPWRPILTYGPPSADRPALTLLPPYGSSGSSGSFGNSGSSGSFGSTGGSGNFGNSGNFGGIGSSGSFGTTGSSGSFGSSGSSGSFGNSGSSGSFGNSGSFGGIGSSGSFGSTGSSGSFGNTGSSGSFGSTGSSGSLPGEAYLPPVASSHQQNYQQQQSGLFDNLSDAEIEHIFAQAANLAAQSTPYRKQHRTFSRY